MNVALSGTEFAPGELELFLAYCERMGVRALEMWCPDHVALDNVADVRKRLDRDSFKTICVSTHTELNQPDGAAKYGPLILESIKLASELGTDLVNTYFGSNPDRTFDQAIAAFAKNIDPCLKEAEKRGITIVVENEFDYKDTDLSCTDITRRAEGVAELIAKIGSPFFRSNLDATNFLLAGEEPFPRAYEMLKDVIGYVHVKNATRYDESRHGPREDNFIWHDGKHEFVMRSAGHGAVNWDGLLAALKRDGYSGWFAIEPHVLHSDLDRVCGETLEYLRSRL